MGARNPDRVSFGEIASGRETVREMRQRKFVVAAACSKCGVWHLVDLGALELLYGPNFSFWNRHPPCRVIEGEHRCTGKISFHAKARPNMRGWARLADPPAKPPRRDQASGRPEPPPPEAAPEGPPAKWDYVGRPTGPGPEVDMNRRLYEHRPPLAWRGRNEPLEEPSATMAQLLAQRCHVEFICNKCRRGQVHAIDAMIALFGADTHLVDLARGLTCLRGDPLCEGSMWATVTLSAPGPGEKSRGRSFGSFEKSYYICYGVQPPDGAKDG